MATQPTNSHGMNGNQQLCPSGWEQTAEATYPNHSKVTLWLHSWGFFCHGHDCTHHAGGWLVHLVIVSVQLALETTQDRHSNWWLFSLQPMCQRCVCVRVCKCFLVTKIHWIYLVDFDWIGWLPLTVRQDTIWFYVKRNIRLEMYQQYKTHKCS